MDKTIVSTNQAPAAIGPYSQAVRVGNMLFTSGQIPLTAEGELVIGDIEAQTRQVFKNLQAILDEVHFSFLDVVKATVFISNMNDFAGMNKIYAEYFTDNLPARSTVQVAKLPKDAGVEIELIAVRG